MSFHQYLFWDFDGTLAYRDGMWTQTVFDLLQENGFYQIGFDEIRPYLQQGFPWHKPELPHETFFGGISWWEYMTGYFKTVLRELGVDGIPADEIAEQIRGEYLDQTKWHLFGDTVPCLKKAVEKGYINAIVSNHVPELPELVSGLGIEYYFTRIYTSGLVGYEKPNPAIYRTALEGLDKPCEVTMIGDNMAADVEGARNAGLKAILVRKENAGDYPYYCADLNGIFDLLPAVIQ